MSGDKIEEASKQRPSYWGGRFGFGCLSASTSNKQKRSHANGLSRGESQPPRKASPTA
ncbi:MAG: hypothetical protein OT477_05820 [Chloroflexi bacterium]|nr:hypothetical protein [Chloroflexota bacterium]